MIAIAGCEKEVPPPSVEDYLDNPNILEAAVVRCAQNRSETRYEAECVNARQAVSIIEAKEERARRDAFEKESERKREALRRTQQAAAEARRMAEEAERRRREAEYLAQFGELPPAETDETGAGVAETNAPGAVIPAPQQPGSGVVLDPMPARDGGNAAGAAQPQRQPQAPPPAPPQTPPAQPEQQPSTQPEAQQAPINDLEAVREELRRRSEDPDS